MCCHSVCVVLCVLECVVVQSVLCYVFWSVLLFRVCFVVCFRGVFAVGADTHIAGLEQVKQNVLAGTSNWAAKVAITGTTTTLVVPLSLSPIPSISHISRIIYSDLGHTFNVYMF